METVIVCQGRDILEITICGDRIVDSVKIDEVR